MDFKIAWTALAAESRRVLQGFGINLMAKDIARTLPLRRLPDYLDP